MPIGVCVLEQPPAGLAEQVHDLALLQHREVDGLAGVGGEPRHVRAGDLGEAEAREQRRHEARDLEPEPEAARARIALQVAALGEHRGEPVHGRQREAERVRDLGLRQLGLRAREQPEDVEAARERSHRGFSPRNFLSHVGCVTIRAAFPTASTTRVQIRTDFPRTVRTVEHLWIPLSDGCRLAARMWLPEDAERDPVPAILDAVPVPQGRRHRGGRRRPGTAYFAGHGYARRAARPARQRRRRRAASPTSTPSRRQRDVDEVIAWLAAQPWCSGAVGMIGVSWGGFAALQAAARNPPALRGIVPIHASDDRYADDVHYFGGCVLATDMVHWSTCMAAYVGQPPDPAVVGEGWRERVARAASTRMEPWVATWLAHQRRDDYWRQGSACERYADDRVSRCSRSAAGSDGYRDMVLRMVEHVARAGARADRAVGAHAARRRGAPGPAIGFLQECVRFFDHALKGADERVLRRAGARQLHAGAIGP